MINYDDAPADQQHYISVTEFRRHLSHYIALVRYGDDFICITRRGGNPVYLVSEADFDLIREQEEILDHGPRDENGERMQSDGLMSRLRDLIRWERKSPEEKERIAREEEREAWEKRESDLESERVFREVMMLYPGGRLR